MSVDSQQDKIYSDRSSHDRQFPILNNDSSRSNPGFQKSSNSNTNNDSSQNTFSEFFDNFLNLLGVNEFWKNLLKIVSPFLKKIFDFLKTVPSLLPLFVNGLFNNES